MSKKAKRKKVLYWAEVLSWDWRLLLYAVFSIWTLLVSMDPIYIIFNNYFFCFTLKSYPTFKFSRNPTFNNIAPLVVKVFWPVPSYSPVLKNRIVVTSSNNNVSLGEETSNDRTWRLLRYCTFERLRVVTIPEKIDSQKCLSKLLV